MSTVLHIVGLGIGPPALVAYLIDVSKRAR